MKVNAVGVFPANMEQSVRFYENVLNMKAFAAGGQEYWDGGGYAEFHMEGDCGFGLFSRKDLEAMISKKLDDPSGINGRTGISLDYPEYGDVDKEFHRIISAGATPVLEPVDMPWGQRTSYVADPDGNLIEIASMGQGEQK